MIFIIFYLQLTYSRWKHNFGQRPLIMFTLAWAHEDEQQFCQSMVVLLSTPYGEFFKPILIFMVNVG